MYASLRKELKTVLSQIKESGFLRQETIFSSPQGAEISLPNGRKLLNFCSNNYLGLSSHPRVVQAATRAMQTHGFGLSSVRFISGTQDIHKELESRLSEFLETEDTILYAAAFDANGGLFEPIFDEKDVIISDTLNHASLIDGIRLCKAQRIRYAHNDMNSLEEALKQSQDARHRAIVTDGVFSMDGNMAQLGNICALARRYKALTVVDDCHATGFMGPNGGGTPDYHRVTKQVDLITGTLGKALGGASGGFTSGRKEIIELLRQRSRPYLFSNALAPPIVRASLEALQIVSESDTERKKLMEQTAYFRTRIQEVGYIIAQGDHPIIPLMLHDGLMAHKLAERLLSAGIYVVGFSYPVVPKGQARIRIQISCLHEKEHLDKLLLALEKEGIALGVI